MPMHRRCLVPGCDCTGFTISMDAYSTADDEEDLVESGRDELQTYCERCGHNETEHELAPAD